jgi:hypothetical protein
MIPFRGWRYFWRQRGTDYLPLVPAPSPPLPQRAVLFRKLDAPCLVLMNSVLTLVGIIGRDREEFLRQPTAHPQLLPWGIIPQIANPSTGLSPQAPQGASPNSARHVTDCYVRAESAKSIESRRDDTGFSPTPFSPCGNPSAQHANTISSSDPSWRESHHC